MRRWRNWQTHRSQKPALAGSTPALRTVEGEPAVGRWAGLENRWASGPGVRLLLLPLEARAGRGPGPRCYRVRAERRAVRLRRLPLSRALANALAKPHISWMVDSPRECKRCREVKPAAAFTAELGIRRRTCRACRRAMERARDPEASKRMLERQKAVAREERRTGHDRGKYIIHDSRKSDRRAGRENDLSREMVDALISKPCTYCGVEGVRMTLDRIDNSLGHLIANVQPSCLRCNYLRGSMPYEAWVFLVPIIREAHERGLFGEWRSAPIARPGKDEFHVSSVEDDRAPRGRIEVSCAGCGRAFERLASRERRRVRNDERGPFCGKSCARSNQVAMGTGPHTGRRQSSAARPPGGAVSA
jgi:hypothetical protein